MNIKNNMFELLLTIQETEDMQQKMELMQEVLLHSEFCENYNFLLQFECGVDGEVWRKEKNQLRKFLEYKDKKSETAFYGDADCDVSLAAMVAYKLLYSDLGNATLERKFNSNLRYEYSLDGVRYGGDTLTSAHTVLKRYLDFAGIQSKNLQTEKWNEEVAARVDEIWQQMDEKAKAFLKQYMTLGNYICIPCKGYQLPSGYWTSVNCGRSNYGQWDTVDRFLWKMYQYFYTNDSTKLLELFTDYKEVLRDDVLAWNEQFHIKTWNDFVEVHALQDFVEVLDSKKKTYGRPMGLKSGKKIDVPIEEEYNPMPQNEEECKVFFEIATSCIQKRGQRIVGNI